MPLQLQVRQTGLEKSIQEGMKKAGRNLKLNLGNTRNIDALSQPLGRLTGKADEFTKSMEAANARVLAFGASVGVIAAVTKGMQELVRTTIEVEKSLANINSILRQSDAQMSSFKDTLFDVARNTEQTFASVADAALELSRQGLKAEEVTKRLNDALVLSRLSGMSAADSVAGLTAAINSFSSAGITSAEVLNKISAAAASAAVSDRDLIEGLKRSGAVAVSTGVEFDQLVGIIGSLQEKTARGGAVIGNSLKTIFTRLQDVDRLTSLQNLGVQVTDLQGNVLSANKVIENLAPTFAKLDQASKVNLADNLVGKFQIAPFLSLLEQYNEEVVRSSEIAKVSFGATNEAYERNIALNQTLSAVLNEAVINLRELGNTLGEIGVTDNLKSVLEFFSNITESLQGTLDGEGAGSTFAKGLVKGIGAILSGPGLVLLAAVVTKLAFGFVKFGASSLKTFFGLNQAAKEHANLQGQITAALLNDSSIRQDILHIENKSISVEEKRKQQVEAITAAMNAQLQVMHQMQSISQGITPSVAANTKAARSKSAAGGFLPIGAESSDIARGVGGAPSSAKPVVIPNFAFGGGKRGTMVANSSEYIIPNYANGGDAIFNQNMASSMGLPANAKKVRAASGYIPNFAQGDPINSKGRYIMLHGEHGKTDANKMAYYHPETGKYNVTNQEGALAIRVPVHGLTDANKGNTVNEYIKEYEDFAIDQGFKKSRELTKHLPTKQVESAIKSKVNSGAVAGFAGSIYELALASMLTDEEFKNYADQTETSNFDLNLQGQEKLLKLYGIGTKPLFGEVKGRNNPDNVASSAAKIHRVMGMEGKAKQSAQTGKLIGKRLSVADAKRFGITPSNKRFHTITASDIEKINSQTPEGQRVSFSSGKNPMFSGFVKRSASGYIPNFADPLQDAIGREQAAGLPVSQIRINQSGKLRNSQNPMGLAVTNTRDEPTGAVPNFAQYRDSRGRFAKAPTPIQDIKRVIPTESLKNLGNSTDKVSKAQGSSLGVIFGVQAGMTALSAATADSTSTMAKYTSIVADSLSTATSFVFAGQGIAEFGENLQASGAEAEGFMGKAKGVIGGFVGELGTFGAAIGVGIEGFKAFEGLAAEYLGMNKVISNSTSRLASAFDRLSVKFDSMSTETQDQLNFDAGIAMELSDVAGFADLGGGRDSDIEESLKAQFAKALGAGISIEDRTDIQARKKELQSQGAMSSSDIKELFSMIETATLKLKDIQPNLEDIDLGKGIEEQLANMSTEDFVGSFIKTNRQLAGEGRLGEEVGFQDKAPDLVVKLMEAGFATTASQSKAIEMLRPLAKTKVAEREKEKEGASGEHMKALDLQDLARSKAIVATNIELNKLKLEGRTEDERRLELGKALGTLSLEEEIKLRDKVAKDRFRSDISVKNLGIIGEQVKALEGLKGKTAEVESLTADINKAAEDGNLDFDKRAEILDAISGILASGEVTAKTQLKILKDTLEGEKKITAEKLKQLGFDLDDASDQDRKLQQQRLIVSASKMASDVRGRTSKNALQDKIFEQEGRLRQSQAGMSNMMFDPFSQQSAKFGIAGQQAELAKSRGELNRLDTIERFRSLKLPKGQEAFQVRMSTMEDPKEIRNTINDALKEIKDTQIITDISNAALGFENELSRNKEATKASVDATRDLSRTIQQEGRANVKRAQVLSSLGFSREEAADLKRLGEAQQSGVGVPEDQARLAKMKRGFRQRVTESTDTSLEASDKLKDNLVSASRQFVMNMDEAFRNAISSSDSLGDALLNISKQFLSDITSAYSKKFLNKAFGDVFGVKDKATGGFISGGSGHKDDVPAMLMGGEFVMRKSAVQKYGAGFFNALNSGGVQGYASGGSVRQRRDEEGLFRTPSSSSGYISGVSDLMSFATQSPNRMGGDSFVSGGATAAFLDPESARLSMFGRRSSQQFGKVQDAKKQAFDLAVAEMGQMDQARIAGKESSGQFFKDILSAGISAGLGGLGADMFKGNKFLTAASGFGSNLLGTAITGGGASGFGNFGAGYVSSMQESGSKGLFDFLKSLFSNKQATGGMISSSTGVDTVPTMLSGGEFIMNASATKRLGAGNLQALNSGSGGGGDNSQLVGKLDELITATESASGGEINITINSEGKENVKTSEGASEDQKKLSERIKTVVKQVITDEKRLGGQLRK
jgi:TP901 family phage tail tape measure protein